MRETAYSLVSHSDMRTLCVQIFTKLGFSEADAAFISDVLLQADLNGIESHGVQRLIRYYNALLDGEVDVHANLETVHETPVSATIDAHGAMGQLAARAGMSLAIEKAKKTGICMVAVRNSNHYGIAGYYSLMAAAQDLIGICMTNTEAIMVPTFGSKAMLGTNPIALAMPASPTVFSFDAATTVVPRGKLEVYSKRWQALPSGWALDAQGRESTDAGEVLHNIIHKIGGGIAPLGGTGEAHSGYKGYGFGLICELFTSVMAGGPPASRCVTASTNSLSHGFWAVDYGIFGDKETIRENFSAYLQELRDTPKADGEHRVYIHGEKELESSREKQLSGIPVNSKTIAELRMICSELGISLPAFLPDTPAEKSP